MNKETIFRKSFHKKVDQGFSCWTPIPWKSTNGNMRRYGSLPQVVASHEEVLFLLLFCKASPIPVFCVVTNPDFIWITYFARSIMQFTNKYSRKSKSRWRASEHLLLSSHATSYPVILFTMSLRVFILLL